MISKNSGEIGRTYFLPVKSISDNESKLLRFVGADIGEDKSWGQFELSLVKAISGDYSKILFSENFLNWRHWSEAIAQVQAVGLSVSIQVTPRYLLFLKPKHLKTLQQQNVDIEILVVVGEENSLDSVFQRLDEKALSITLLMTKGLDAKVILSRFSKSKHKIWFYFPTPVSGERELFSVNQIFDTVESINKKFPDFVVRPPPGIDIFEPKADQKRDFEPVITPEFEVKMENSQPEISVIIPVYNNRIYLSVVVKHLLRQDLERQRYEIIIVDDGSSDGTREYLEDLILGERQELNFKYLFFPREKQRVMGDGGFRAGVARNVGVKNAVGSIYAFLDSDIITPPDYLSQLIHQHQSYDVIQGRRLELLKQRSHSQTVYQDIDPQIDTYIVDGGYWLGFLNSSQPWADIESGWKFVCTHSLSVKADLFKQVGWFRKTFIFYGYEDTELGYRLWQAGARFGLNWQKVYHLYHADIRSEFANSHAKKLMLLSNTAPVFYINTLSKEVYFHLKYLFDPFFKIKLLIQPGWIGLKSSMQPINHFLVAVIYFIITSCKQACEALIQTIAAPVQVVLKNKKIKKANEAWIKGLQGELTEKPVNFPGFSKPRELIRFYHCKTQAETGRSYLEQIMQAGNRNYDGIVFSKAIIAEEGVSDVFEFAKTRVKYVVLEIDLEILESMDMRVWVEKMAKTISIHLYVSEYHVRCFPEVNRLMAFDDTYIVLQPNRDFNVSDFLSSIDENFRERVLFDFPIQQSPSDDSMDCHDIMNLFKLLKNQFPDFKPDPVLGLTIQQKNMPVSRPNVEFCELVSQSECPQVEVSIVVYMKEINVQFLKFFEFLVGQNCSKDLFEIICVTESHPVNEIKIPQLPGLNITWLGLSALEGSLFTVRGYRSELAYKVGAEEAEGSIIAFLTSDFAVRKNYVSDLINKHRTYDVVIGQAYKPLREDTNSAIEAWAVDPFLEINLLNSKISREVNENGHLINPWLHVGGQAFSVKRELYHWWGGLRSEYVGTGVAVTEWSHRIWRSGAQFYVNGRLFSLFGLGRWSENKIFQKGLYREALRKFHNESLSSCVYHCFRNEMSQFPNIQTSYDRIFNSVWGSPLLPCLRFIVSLPHNWQINWTRTKTNKLFLLKRIDYPIRKAIYFTRYQLKTRCSFLQRKVISEN